MKLPYRWWTTAEFWGIVGWSLVLTIVVGFLLHEWFLG